MPYFVLILGIPRQAESLGAWVLWIAAILLAIGVIITSVVKTVQWGKRTRRENLLATLRPEFTALNEQSAALNEKMDTLTNRNDAQHAEVAAAISTLSDRLDAHNKVFADHLAESALATEQLAVVVAAVETHIGNLREEITNPGLPVTPGPLAQGPPPGRKPMF